MGTKRLNQGCMESSFSSMKSTNSIKNKSHFYNLKHTSSSGQSNLENVCSTENSRSASEKMNKESLNVGKRTKEVGLESFPPFTFHST